MPIISELTKDELFDTADAEMARLLPLLDSLQIRYKTEDVIEEVGTDDEGKAITRTYKRNRFFQGLQTPAAVPLDGKATAVDKTLKPTDQTESWADVGAPLPVTSMTLRVGRATWSRLSSFRGKKRGSGLLMWDPKHIGIKIGHWWHDVEIS